MAEHLQTVQKTLKVVQVLAEGGALSLSEISRRSYMSKSVVHRVLATLREEGWVEQSADSASYRLGLETWRVGFQALGQVAVYGVALPSLERLAAELREATSLSVLDRGEMLFLATTTLIDGGAVSVPAAVRTPPHTTSGGKVALAFLPEVGERVCSSELVALTPYTVTDGDVLRRELEEIRVRGYGVNKQGMNVESCGIAAPVFDHLGNYVASIHTGCRAAAFSESWVAKVAAPTMECASNVSMALGYRYSLATSRSLG